MLPPCVLILDPGKVTGLAWLYDSGARFWTDEYGFRTASDQVEHTCARYQNLLWLMWEAYWVDQRRPQQDAHHALEMIGAARFLGLKYGCRLLDPLQQHTPDAEDQRQLKALGWWKPGCKDSQSSAAHMLRWLRRSGQMPPEVAGKLSAAPATVGPRHRKRTQT